jgi:hypothetical protein
VPFCFIAGNLHPDHDMLAAFRRTFLPELKALFVQVLLLAQGAAGAGENGAENPRGGSFIAALLPISR